MDLILIYKGEVKIGRLVLLDMIAEGIISGVRYDMTGFPRERREIKRAVQTNSEGVSIRGGSRPTNLSIYPEGVIAAATAVADRLGLRLEVKIETASILDGDDDNDGETVN